MASHVLPNMIDEDLAGPLHEHLESEGVHLLAGTRLEGLAADNIGVWQVRFAGGATVDLDPAKDFLCFAIGMRPDVSLFHDLGLEMTKDGIVVDDRMRTSLPDVYAAGDCCTFRSAIDGKPLSGKLATNAVPMARIAARTLAGVDAAYGGFFNGAATCVGGWRVGSTGFTARLAGERGFRTAVGRGETTTLFPMMPGAGPLRVRLVADAEDGRIIGGQALSTLPVTDKIDVITLAIQQGLHLDDLAKLSYSAQPWQSFFPARSAIVDACEDALTALRGR